MGKIESVYIASGLKNYQRVLELKEILAKHDIKVTYDWASVYQKSIEEGRQETEEEWKEFAKLEIEGIIKADLLLCVLPAGRGSHFELGFAYGYHQGMWGNDKPNIILLEDQHKDSVAFYTLPGIVRYSSQDEAISHILKLRTFSISCQVGECTKNFSGD